MSVAADFVLLAWNGLDGQVFDTYNAALVDNTIGIFDRNFGTTVNPNAFRVVVSVSAGHIVQTVRSYGTTGAVTIPVGGYVVTANGTSLPYLTHYHTGDVLEVVPTASCDPRTEAVPIATYHSLGASSAAFESHLQAIDALGYTTISLDQLADYLDFPSTPLPENPIVLTFDDGLDNQIAWAPALLDLYGMVGNFFIITSFPDSAGAQWANWAEINDALDTYPESVVLGCHSHASHYQVNVGGHLVAAYMTTINGETQEQFYDRRFLDLYDCRETLYAETGVDTVSIAWPFGSYDDGLVEQARDAGFEMMLGTFPGLNHPDNDGALGNVRRYGGDLTQAWSVEETAMDRWVVCP